MQVGYQHLFHAAELQIELDRTERAEDDALHPFEIQLQAQGIKQPVDGVQRLLHLLYEENDVLLGQVVVFRAGDGDVTRQVAAHEDTFRMSAPVVGVAGNPVLWQRAEEDVSCQGAGRLLSAGYLERHRPVHTHHA